MADNNPDDDIYNDPATIGGVANDDDDVIDVAPDKAPSSAFAPEKDTTDLDDRGTIDELELADAKDTETDPDDVDEALLDDAPSSAVDGDSYDPASEVIADERDGNDPA